ncbi:MAG: glycosyltransferase family 2 protein [Proteobacteria bacterium]|nr:glycosyltransferase family 2 protein [Pseudomonadota bacterium]MBS0572394.1 glycosyltransferase family 2 protein [Pseudomonadota bacterium]
MTARPEAAPRVLAILTVRNEGAFLIDWLAWHRHAGFTDFLVFSNDCDDGSDLMLDRLADLGWLAHLRNPGPWKEGPQWAALKSAETHPLRRAADWIMALDIDEFVTIHTGDGTLSALFAALPEATALPLTWRLYGNGGAYGHEDRPVPERFVRAAPAVMGWPWRAAMFKTLFRNDGSYGRLGVHRPRKPDPARLSGQRWFDGSGRELPAAYHSGRLFSPYGQDNYRLAQLNHYALGSMQDYVLKSDRGRANRAASGFDLSYWVERNLTQETDSRLAARFAGCAPLRDRLRADPVLAGLHRRAVGWRQERFAALMADEAWRALLGRLMMAGESRLPDAAEQRLLMDLAAGQQSGRSG